jgi:hypothetical protein
MAPQPSKTDELAPLVNRVRAEYTEMPGLHLTAGQARRLWGLDEHDCETVLSTLVEARFLRRDEKGMFVRAA